MPPATMDMTPTGDEQHACHVLCFLAARLVRAHEAVVDPVAAVVLIMCCRGFDHARCRHLLCGRQITPSCAAARFRCGRHRGLVCANLLCSTEHLVLYSSQLRHAHVVGRIHARIGGCDNGHQVVPIAGIGDGIPCRTVRNSGHVRGGRVLKGRDHDRIRPLPS